VIDLANLSVHSPITEHYIVGEAPVLFEERVDGVSDLILDQARESTDFRTNLGEIRLHSFFIMGLSGHVSSAPHR
jgi:hypothetical protein